jgi:hypothetical protein
MYGENLKVTKLTRKSKFVDSVRPPDKNNVDSGYLVLFVSCGW